MKINLVQMEQQYVGLALNFQVNPDSCGNHLHYENYIRLMSVRDYLEGRGTTHVVIEERDGNHRILGYITLRASSLIKNSSNSVCGDPAIEIAELAVSKDYEKNRLGTLLVQYAITLASETNRITAGVRYIVLCADEQAVSFYERFGFEKLASYYEIPREGWSVNCIPMFLKLPNLAD